MRKVLMRAGMSPLDNFDPYHVLMHNTIGNNTGNMLFPYSLFRTLTLEDTEIVAYSKINPEDADWINEEFECFVIPLANAFRVDFIRILRDLTDLVRKLKIPCVVVGVGLQTEIDPTFKDSYPFDDDVKKFVSAILEKSSSIGVRGEITEAYLKKLGFSQVKVIGCPSMYMNGDQINVNKKILRPASMVCINGHGNFPKLHDFLEKSKRLLPNYYFIPQEKIELELVYAGVPLPASKKLPPNYPKKLSDEAYVQNRVRMFVNVPSWRQFISQATFSFGSRIHGNIISILSGTPSFIFAADSRVRELSEYHNIPHMWVKDIKDDTNIIDIYEKTDFSSVQKGHSERFRRFVDFLNENGLKHIYQDLNIKEVPFDKQIQNIDFHGPVEVITGVSPWEVANRLNLFYGHINRKIEKLESKIASLKKKV